jgi:glycosyltransferase involved in cell wall biosynthesis
MIKNRVWVYTICYNEEHFVKHFLAAYAGAERIVAYDNMSTDRTVELLRQDPRVEVRPFVSGETLRDDIHMEIKNHAWKEARGKAEWVICVDFDEIFNRCYTSEGVAKFDLDFTQATKLGYNIIRPFGYGMVSMDAPLGGEGHPYNFVNRAVYHVPEEKMVCFNPNEIREMRFHCGAHECAPLDREQSTANIRVTCAPEYKIMHFKLWNLEYYLNRIKLLRSRQSEFNRGMGVAWHYDQDDQYHRDMFVRSFDLSRNLFEVERPNNDNRYIR